MVVTAQEVKLLTADDLLRLYSKGVRGELIRGVLCKTMAVGGEHGETVVNLVTGLRNFVKPRRLVGWPHQTLAYCWNGRRIRFGSRT